MKLFCSLIVCPFVPFVLAQDDLPRHGDAMMEWLTALIG